MKSLFFLSLLMLAMMFVFMKEKNWIAVVVTGFLFLIFSYLWLYSKRPVSKIRN